MASVPGGRILSKLSSVVGVCDAGASEGLHAVMTKRGVPLGMHRMNPEHLDPDPSDLGSRRYSFEDEPDDEEDDEEKHDRDEENDDPDEGYSE